jgi:chromosome partitioning protein
MAVLVIATSKGGSGKTTLAACLAAFWREREHRVEALDTDPNRNLIARLEGSGISCVGVDEEAILLTIADAATRADIVIVDVAGTLARGLVYAVSAADAVIIPCRPDRNDVVEAVRTQEVIRQAETMTRRRIPHAALLTQVNRRAQVTQQTRQQLQALEVPFLTDDMPSRTAYQQASYTGAPIADPSVYGDIAMIAEAVDQLVKGAPDDGR